MSFKLLLRIWWKLFLCPLIPHNFASNNRKLYLLNPSGDLRLGTLCMFRNQRWNTEIVHTYVKFVLGTTCFSSFSSAFPTPLYNLQPSHGGNSQFCQVASWKQHIWLSCVFLGEGRSPCLRSLSWERHPADFELQSTNGISIKYGWECSCG